MMISKYINYDEPVSMLTECRGKRQIKQGYSSLWYGIPNNYLSSINWVN